MVRKKRECQDLSKQSITRASLIDFYQLAIGDICYILLMTGVIPLQHPPLVLVSVIW
jgi:hypothetical protein